jgi:hypothetical protein
LPRNPPVKLKQFKCIVMPKIKRKDKGFKYGKQSCPAGCGYQMDMALCALGKATPIPGDFLICMKCCAVLRFEEGFKLRLSSLEESAEFGLRSQMELAIDAAKRVRAQRALKAIGL